MFNGTVQQLVLEVWLAMILYGNKQFIIGLVTNNWKKNLSFYISGSLYGLTYYFFYQNKTNKTQQQITYQ